MRPNCFVLTFAVSAGLLAGLSQANACPNQTQPLPEGSGYLVQSPSATAVSPSWVPGKGYRITSELPKPRAGATFSRNSSAGGTNPAATPIQLPGVVKTAKVSGARVQAKSSPVPQPLPKPRLPKPKPGPRPAPALR